jgi:hypothetical protein
MPTKEEMAMSIYKKIQDPEKKEAFRVYAKQKGVEIPTIGVAQPIGPLDYLVGAAEMIPTIATGAVAEPIAGAGAAIAAIKGEDPTQVAERVRQELTYAPRTAGAQDIMRRIGKFVQPIGEAEQAITEKAFEIGGPAAAATAATLPTAVSEILGLGGTRTAKRIGLRRAVKRAGKDVSQLYDELGNLLPEIRKSIDEAGLDIREFEDILPERVPEEVAPTVEKIKRAEEAQILPGQKYKELVEEVQPSQEVLEAYEDLGLTTQMIPSIVSQNPIYVAIEQGLKSVPGSQLAVREKAFVSELADKSDSLIEEFGGTIDKSKLSDDFRTKSKELVSNLEDSENQIRERIDKSIGPDKRKSVIDATNINNMLNEIAEELGGVDQLGTIERNLLKKLEPGSKPTYARLESLRRQIGRGLRNTGPFKDADQGNLKRIYGALAEDQSIAADKFGVGDIYRLANDMTVQRKTIENQLIKSLGRELYGDITTKAKSAMLGLQRGNTKDFDKMIENIPKEIDKDLRKSVIASSLNDAFTQGSRKERALNIAGFDDFMTGLKRNPVAKKRLESEIGTESMKRLNTFHKIVGAVRKAQTQAITTGRIQAVPGMFDEVNNIAKRVYGTAEKAVSMIPGMRIAGAVVDAIKAEKTPRSVAADQFLSSPKFQNIIKQYTTGNLKTKNKLQQAEKTVEKMKAYQQWKDTLAEAELKDLGTVGVIGYLTGETVNQGEEK